MKASRPWDAKSAAYERFIASTDVTYGMVVNAESYDLGALSEMPASERLAIETLLINKPRLDWWDIEALLLLETPRAMARVRESLNDRYRAVRLKAAEGLYLRGEPDALEAAVIEGLENADLGTDVLLAESLAEKYPTQAIKRALLEGMEHRPDQLISFGSRLLVIWGLIDNWFDEEFQPFFDGAANLSPSERVGIFRDRCRAAGVKDALLD